MVEQQTQARPQTQVNPSNLFGLDIGRGMTKVVSGTGRHEAIESYCMRGFKRMFAQGGSSKIVSKVDGIEYFLDELARKEGANKHLTKSKNHENTTALGLTALHLCGGNGEIHVFTCVPLDSWEQEGPLVQKRLKGEHNVEVGGVRRTIYVKTCAVIPETWAFASLWNEQGLVRIVDAGAKDTTLLTLDDGDLVENGTTVVPEGWETSNGGDKGVAPFVNLLAKEAGSRGWAESDKVVLIGSRAEDMLEAWKQNGFSSTTLPKGTDPGFANAYGCLEAGKEHFNVG